MFLKGGGQSLDGSERRTEERESSQTIPCPHLFNSNTKMHIISLKKLVEENDINAVSVFIGEGVSDEVWEVGSTEYEVHQYFLVKGEYSMNQDPMTMKKTLFVKRLEEELNITLNHPAIIADDVSPEEEAKLEEYINTPVTAIVFNRHTLDSAGRETKRKFITAYAESVIESFIKNKGEADREDFAVIEIDWENRAISIKRIPDAVVE